MLFQLLHVPIWYSFIEISLFKEGYYIEPIESSLIQILWSHYVEQILNCSFILIESILHVFESLLLLSNDFSPVSEHFPKCDFVSEYVSNLFSSFPPPLFSPLVYHSIQVESFHTLHHSLPHFIRFLSFTLPLHSVLYQCEHSLSD